MTEEKEAPRFTAAQREILVKIAGLYPEQVTRLQLFLQSIVSREQRQIPRSEVREKLKDLQRALAHVEKRYMKLAMPSSVVSGTASAALYLAIDTLGHERDALLDSLATATEIVACALDAMPPARPRKFPHSDYVRLILKALQLGHVEHFQRLRQSVPSFDIRVSRKRKPFPEVAGVVSDATGGWSVDDAIRAWLKESRGSAAKVGNLRRRNRH
jgi:hypothetical protein